MYLCSALQMRGIRRVSPWTKSTQGAILGLLHAQRRRKSSLGLSTSPEAGPGHQQLNTGLSQASPAPFPSPFSLPGAALHICSPSGPLSPRWSHVPDLFAQNLGHFQSSNLSTPGFLSQIATREEEATKCKPQPDTLCPATATFRWVVCGLDTHSSAVSSHLRRKPPNENQDEGRFWKASYHQSLKNKTNKGLFSAAVARTELSPRGPSRMWLRYIREEQLSAWTCLKLAQREGFLHLFIYLFVKRPLLIRCKFSTKASSHYKGAANIYQLHRGGSPSTLCLNFCLALDALGIEAVKITVILWMSGCRNIYGRAVLNAAASSEDQCIIYLVLRGSLGRNHRKWARDLNLAPFRYTPLPPQQVSYYA